MNNSTEPKTEVNDDANSPLTVTISEGDGEEHAEAASAEPENQGRPSAAAAAAEAPPPPPPSKVAISSTPNNRTESDLTEALVEEKQQNGGSCEDHQSSSSSPPPPPPEEQPTSPLLENGAATQKQLQHDESAEVPLSPSRGSMMSSLASSSVNDETYDGDDQHDPQEDLHESDDDDDDGIGNSNNNRVTIDPMLLFGGDSSTKAMRPETAAAAGAGTTDDKSFRSVESRPDPPSILDGKDQNEAVENTTSKSNSAVADDANADPPSILNGINENSKVLVEKHESQAPPETNKDDPINTDVTFVEQQQASRNDATANDLLPTISSGSNREVMMSPENMAAHALAILSAGGVTAESAPSEGQANSETNEFKQPVPEEAASVATTLESVPMDASELMVDDSVLQSHHSQTMLTGPDNLMVLPRVDENRFYTSPALQPRQILQSHPQLATPSLDGQAQQQSHNAAGFVPALQQAPVPGLGMLQHIGGHHHHPLASVGVGGGRRKIRLRLQEEVKNTVGTIRKHFRTTSLLGSLKRNSTRVLRFGAGSSRSMEFDDDLEPPMQALYRTVDRGTITVSWYEGTSSLELQHHVRKTIVRKLKLESSNLDLDDIRILDESVVPPEEIVLSPFIPDGSQFLLRFSTISEKDKLKTHTDGTTTPRSEWSGRPPLSPSAAPSPHPEKDLLSNLNPNQLALLNSMKMPSEKAKYEERKSRRKATAAAAPTTAKKDLDAANPLVDDRESDANAHPLKREETPIKPDEELTDTMGDGDDGDDDEDDMMLHSEDPIETRLRQITEILLADRKKSDGSGRLRRREEKRQVIFVVANYFVLFLALIAISAELQMRAPNWLKKMEDQLQSVQNCGESQEALYECISRGDFAGLIASLILWLSRSVATKQFFLFGFDTPKKLWNVVYESLVTSICWGISYLFIRRGMNPDTRPRFVQKYWKDAVYGSLAGFNAAFLKQVLKNLIPQEVVEDALRERHLKVLGWLPSFA